MAIATGLAVSNIYFKQPLLGEMGKTLGGEAVALVPMATQIGYAAGLFLLVPLADAIDRRRLIISQFAALSVALLLIACARSAFSAVLGALLVGVGASVAQQVVAFAAHLALPERRGAIVGRVMAGLLGGILLSRVAAGIVADQWGWRAVFAFAAPVMLIAAASLAVSLPASRPQRLPYGRLIGSLAQLWKELPALRLAAITQGLLFASLSAFWAVLALRLAEAPFHLGPRVAGFIGLAGLAGAVAAPGAGSLADRRGPRVVILAGCLLTLAAWLLLGLTATLLGIVAGVALLDFAVQGTLVAHQHRVLALRSEAQARLNTVLVTGTFLGGATGSLIGVAAWHRGGWSCVAILGSLLAAFAVALQLKARRSPESAG